MDNDGKNTIQELRARVETLIELHEGAKSDNVRLQNENEQLKKELKQKDDELVGFRDKLTTLEVAKGLASTENTHDAKIKINRIVREIDKCIALLNK